MIKICLVALLVLLALEAKADGQKLSCSESNQGAEAKFLTQAPGHAKRVSEHVLEVRYASGVKRFTDKPPFEDWDIRWMYCGYDKINQIHLIGKNNGELFTGLILFEKSGNIIQAGFEILVAPNKSMYLAIEQTDGKECEDWSLYEKNGHKLWSGNACIAQRLPGANYGDIVAEFVDPNWTAQSVLVAFTQCSDMTKKGPIYLKMQSKKWAWAPVPKCLMEDNR